LFIITELLLLILALSQMVKIIQRYYCLSL